MNEAETRAEHIDPALKKAGWGEVEDSRIRREYYITLGRLEGNGSRKKGKKADYVLVYKNRKLAVVEAKALHEPVSEGVGQAKEYAEKLSIRFTYSTNGNGIYGIDMLTGNEGEVEKFPTPEELWALTFSEPNVWRDRFSVVANEEKGGTWPSRYYQDIAVERALDALGTKQQRILLTLATGTGKTAIAFQIAWKLYHARWSLSQGQPRMPRILFLADRNILADQAFNAFSKFPEDALVRISPEEIRKKGKVPKNGTIFFTIFQTFMSGPEVDGKPSPYFGGYPADFFDLIIVDECHRGGADDESAWRDILSHFKPAVHLGLTATPKREDNTNTYAYFGEPVFTYSLKDGIDDGYLVPFCVKEISTTLDNYVYDPEDTVLGGKVEPDKIYVEADFQQNIEIKKREKYRVKLLMSMINQAEKTIIFCADQKHASLVRDLINQCKESTDPNYCVRVTAEDGAVGDHHLRDFQDNERSIPTILTTSQKLSTGVDARNVRNIVLMRPINSMIEFKQIVGRGTRLYEGKNFFTIYDFVQAHRHFQDPDWDGEPVKVDTVDESKKNGTEIEAAPKPKGPNVKNVGDGKERPARPTRLKIELADGKFLSIQNTVKTTFRRADGTVVSVEEFLGDLVVVLFGLVQTEEQLRIIWSDSSERGQLLTSLDERNISLPFLAEIQRLLDASDSDIYDVLLRVAFGGKIVSRKDRAAEALKKLTGVDPATMNFIQFVLEHYVNQGVDQLADVNFLPLIKLKYGTLRDARAHLGDLQQAKAAFLDFQKHLYE